MGIGLMLALRRWEPESLKRLRHEPGVQSRATDEVRFKANQLEGRDVRKWPILLKNSFFCLDEKIPRS